MRSQRVSLALSFVLGLSLLVECRAAAPGGDDDLDQRLDNAMVGVRRDRPWQAQGPAARVVSTRLDSFDPAPVSYRRRGDGWEFSLTPFMWVPAICGDLGIRGQAAEVDSSIGDTLEGVIDNFEFVGMARFAARHCKWSIIADLVYVNLGNEYGRDLAGAVQIDVEWDFDQLVAQALVGYRVAEFALGCGDACFKPKATIEALAGVRYYHLGAEIDLDPGPSFDGDQDWIDPVVGARGLFHVTRDLTFNVEGNIGGFGVGSDLSWQLIAGVDWRVARCFSLDAGWMILDVDYEDGDFAFDVRMSGPYIGVTFRF
jgi:hypothetical protein